jgi:hypothetical protein
MLPNYRRLLVTAAVMLWSAGAYAFSASTNVALIPNNHGDATGAGYLPTSDPAFSGMTFTNVPLANVNATTLATFDTAVMNQICDPIGEFSASQRTDIVNFVNAGGKLLIYDSDACGTTPVDYSWLPFPFSTNSPGQSGSYGGTLTIVEQDALASSNPANPAFVNTSLITQDTDAVGDANVMETKDLHWCASMSGTNVNNFTGFVRAYAMFGTGIFIYNGMDTNYMGTDTTPGTADGYENLAKVWLLELQLPNASTLLCSAPVAGPRRSPAPAIGHVGLGILGLLLLVGGRLLLSPTLRRDL